MIEDIRIPLPLYFQWNFVGPHPPVFCSVFTAVKTSIRHGTRDRIPIRSDWILIRSQSDRDRTFDPIKFYTMRKRGTHDCYHYHSFFDDQRSVSSSSSMRNKGVREIGDRSLSQIFSYTARYSQSLTDHGLSDISIVPLETKGLSDLKTNTLSGSDSKR